VPVAGETGVAPPPVLTEPTRRIAGRFAGTLAVRDIDAAVAMLGAVLVLPIRSVR
jgi:hypothetical protein